MGNLFHQICRNGKIEYAYTGHRRGNTGEIPVRLSAIAQQVVEQFDAKITGRFQQVLKIDKMNKSIDTSLNATQQEDIIIYNTDDGLSSVVLISTDGMVWLSQMQIAKLFATSKQTVSYHVANILKENELPKKAVVKEILTTAADGKSYPVEHYSLDMVLAIGYRIKGVRGTQFRQWATRNLSEYMVKGFVIDTERLKNPDGRPDYFDELLAKIRDIRASEKRFYQKLRDLFKLSSDYVAEDKSTQMFFAETQNKLLYAVTHHTAAEIVMERADAQKQNMGLTSWKGSIVRKQDVLSGKGSISNQQMEKQVLRIYDKFDKRRKAFDAAEADRQDMLELRELEESIKHR